MEDFVRQRLEAFLQQNSPIASTSLSNVDDIVLEYIVEVLSNLGEEDSSFDVDQFSEMIAAYVPEFAEVDSAVVCEWVFQLASEQQRRRSSSVAETPECVQTSGTPSSGNSSVQEEYPNVLSEVNRVNSQDDSRCTFSAQSQVCKKNNKEEGRGELEDCNPDHLTLLTEMFPEHSREEVHRVLLMCKGNLDSCTQMLLDHLGPHSEAQDTSQERDCMESHEGSVKKKSWSDAKEDEHLKDFVLSRYAFVDVDEDKVFHRPCMPKTGSKKLIRYRDNHVVTTKGERFIVPSKRDQEGEDMKKTYVNLKPLRKYRFH